MNEPGIGVYGVDFKDRKGWLLFFGICQCILGILSALAIPAMLMGIVLSAINPEVAAQANTSVTQVIPAVLVYALAAAWFVTMGIGSIRCRRWARALTLASSWFWLVCGVFGMVFMICLMPIIMSQMKTGAQQGAELPSEFFVIMKIVMIGFMAVLYVLLPLVLVLFYGGKNVRLTCEHWDEKERWTDKCPIPVLGLCILLALWVFSMPTLAFQNWAVPFFGVVLDSYAGAAVIISMTLLMALVVWRLYKLDTLAWWGAVVLVIVWFSSFILTFASDKIWDFYAKFNMTAEQIDKMKEFEGFLPMIIAMFSVWMVGLVGYLIFIKRYFKKDSLEDRSLIWEQV